MKKTTYEKHKNKLRNHIAWLTQRKCAIIYGIDPDVPAAQIGKRLRSIAKQIDKYHKLEHTLKKAWIW